MLKKLTIFALTLSVSLNMANAVELDEATLTIPLDNSGKQTVLTLEQVKRGKRLFNASCGSCHTGGITKTNPNVGLDTEALSLATPYRNSVAGLVEYMKNPTTFDGLESIAEIHPSVASADIFRKCVRFQRMIFLLLLVTSYYNLKLSQKNGVAVRFTIKSYIW